MSVKDALERRFIEAGHDLDIIELDEMWHYTQKNSKTLGMVCCASCLKTNRCL